jgi:hypothetical protein
MIIYMLYDPFALGKGAGVEGGEHMEHMEYTNQPVWRQ